MNLSLVTLAVLALDVAPPRPPPAECRADADCMISTFEGCCGSCCPRGPFAVSREQDRASRNRCAAVDCAQPRCEEVRCAAAQPASAFRAVCQQSRCVALPVSAECSTDADCHVEDRGSPGGCGVCGCCPGMNPVAVSGRSRPVRPEPEPVRPQPPPRPLTKKETPPFGLNPGGPPPPPPPNCSPCPAPPQVRAVCSAGRCGLSRVITLDE